MFSRRFQRRAVIAAAAVLLVALSGGCAHDDARDSDVDVFLVARRGRAWTVCLGLMVLSKLAGTRRTLCLNYIVDEEALSLPERDVFTAAEVVGLRPIAGAAGYDAFLDANDWAAARWDAAPPPPRR